MTSTSTSTVDAAVVWRGEEADLRAKFEAWVRTQPGGIDAALNRRDFHDSDRLGHYVSPQVEFAWQTVCALLLQSAPAEDLRTALVVSPSCERQDQGDPAMTATTSLECSGKVPLLPKGYVAVPKRLTRAMQRVLDNLTSEDGWSWADILMAAEATTVEEDEAIRRFEMLDMLGKAEHEAALRAQEPEGEQSAPHAAAPEALKPMSDNAMDLLLASPGTKSSTKRHLRQLGRRVERDVLARLAAASSPGAAGAVEPQEETPKAFDAFLCRAWGETELPSAEIVLGWEGVRRFMVREWLGKDCATDADGTVTLDRLKAGFDEHEAELESCAYIIEFEIGGVSVERVVGVSDTAVAREVKGAAS